jgi:hypothetical protein
MSTPFAFPYAARIMLRQKGHAPIEYARTSDRRDACNGWYSRMTRDMDPTWDVWLECRANPNELISPRPVDQLSQARRDPEKHLRLSAEETDRLNSQLGLAPAQLV